MTDLHILLTAFADCNLHLCLYAALGLTFLLRAVQCRLENHTEAREHFVHGMVYLLLGLLR